MICAEVCVEARSPPHLAEVARGGGVRAQHGVVRIAREQREAHRRRRARQCECARGDHAECPLRADEELLEVVARVVLTERGEAVEHSAVGEDHLEPKDGAVERSVPQEAQPARVGRHVAANLARAFGAEVERHREAGGRHVLVEGLEDAARLAYEVARELVERENAAARGRAARSGAARSGAAARRWRAWRGRAHFIRESESTTSSATGTEPPTRPVFPPCGTTLIRRSLQCARIADTSAVLPGRTAAAERPTCARIQSVLYCSSEVRSVMTLAGPTIDAKCSRSSRPAAARVDSRRAKLGVTRGRHRRSMARRLRARRSAQIEPRLRVKRRRPDCASRPILPNSASRCRRPPATWMRACAIRKGSS